MRIFQTVVSLEITLNNTRTISIVSTQPNEFFMMVVFICSFDNVSISASAELSSWFKNLQYKLISRLRCMRVVVLTLERQGFLPAETLSSFDTAAFGKVKKITSVSHKLIVKSCILPFLEV